MNQKEVTDELEAWIPAFPVVIPAGDNFVSDVGMSLRDYFAAKALHMLANPLYDRWNWKEISKAAYAIADAMMAERGKGTA